jgi:DsbC/DsbD-like thiol-disulfide interchange protein
VWRGPICEGSGARNSKQTEWLQVPAVIPAGSLQFNEMSMFRVFNPRRRSGLCAFAVAMTCLALISPVLSKPVRAGEITTEWIEGERHRARLFAGDVAGAAPGTVMAFVEMNMDRGWKTYWRNPGTAGGIPPEFDWSRSKNIAKAEVLFPVPTVMSDKAGDVIGYREYAIFPVRITPADSTLPVAINVSANYGICEKLCVPAETQFTLTVPPGPLPAAGSDAQRAYDAVPRAAAGLKPGDPVGLKVERPAGSQWVIRLSAEFPGDASAASMFLAIDNGRFLPTPVRQAPTRGQRAVFDVVFADPEDLSALKGSTVTVVMAGEKGQSEDRFVID